MKTTIEIADSLLNEARKLAAAERTTVRALVEEGLRQVVGRRRRRGKFRLRRASFRGKGLQAGVSDGSWERVREMIYEGRGA
jgi:Arc/MetJ family transcription regulator